MRPDALRSSIAFVLALALSFAARTTHADTLRTTRSPLRPSRVARVSRRVTAPVARTAPPSHMPRALRVARVADHGGTVAGRPPEVARDGILPVLDAYATLNDHASRWLRRHPEGLAAMPLGVVARRPVDTIRREIRAWLPRLEAFPQLREVGESLLTAADALPARDYPYLHTLQLGARYASFRTACSESQGARRYDPHGEALWKRTTVRTLQLREAVGLPTEMPWTKYADGDNGLRIHFNPRFPSRVVTSDASFLETGRVRLLADGDIGLMDIAIQRLAGVTPLGISTVDQQSADGQSLDPERFFLHDVGHGRTWQDARPTTLRATRRDLQQMRRVLPRVFRQVRVRTEADLERAVGILFFERFHEDSDSWSDYRRTGFRGYMMGESGMGTKAPAPPSGDIAVHSMVTPNHRDVPPLGTFQTAIARLDEAREANLGKRVARR